MGRRPRDILYKKSAPKVGPTFKVKNLLFWGANSFLFEYMLDNMGDKNDSYVSKKRIHYP